MAALQLGPAWQLEPGSGAPLHRVQHVVRLEHMHAPAPTPSLPPRSRRSVSAKNAGAAAARDADRPPAMPVPLLLVTLVLLASRQVGMPLGGVVSMQNNPPQQPSRRPPHGPPVGMHAAEVAGVVAALRAVVVVVGVRLEIPPWTPGVANAQWLLSQSWPACTDATTYSRSKGSMARTVTAITSHRANSHW